jgi:hypothetical protein
MVRGKGVILRRHHGVSHKGGEFVGLHGSHSFPAATEACPGAAVRAEGTV